MRFLYEFKTSENERRSGEIVAASRDDAYARLKKSGIRPYKVDLAPGFFNRVMSIGKRGFAIVVLVVALLVAVVLLLSTFKTLRVSQEFQMSKTRRQVIGDTAVVEKGIRSGWDFAFSEDGERFLASFAVPGVQAGKRNTTEHEIVRSLDRSVFPEPGDSIEVRQIKCMVEGMKDELRAFLAAGGSVVEYGNALVRRQEEELGYYNRAKAEISNAVKKGLPRAEVEALLDDRNSGLRRMGIRLVSPPEDF